MINPFHREACSDYACFQSMPSLLILNNYRFVKTAWHPDTQEAEYIWENLVRQIYSGNLLHP